MSQPGHAGSGRGGSGRGAKRPSGGRGEEKQVPEAEFRSYYGRQIIKSPVWKSPDVPLYRLACVVDQHVSDRQRQSTAAVFRRPAGDDERGGQDQGCEESDLRELGGAGADTERTGQPWREDPEPPEYEDACAEHALPAGRGADVA